MAAEQPRQDPKETSGAKSSLESNIVWWALGLIAIGVGGTLGAIKFIDLHIEEQVGLRIKPAIMDLLAKDTTLVNLGIARQQAADALGAATMSQDAAKRSQDNATQNFLLASQQIASAKSTADELLSKINNISNVANLDSVSEKIDQALGKPEFRDAVVQRVLPSGAVVAFSLSQGCPIGWSAFEEAKGRVVVGAGQTNNLDRRGLPLSSYSVGQVGGAETHSLTAEELPPFPLSLEASFAVSAVDRYNAGGKDYPVVTKSSKSIQLGGVGKPVPTMQPYLALFYCRKG